MNYKTALQVIYVVLAILTGYSLCASETQFGKTVEFFAGTGDQFVIVGPETVSVSGTSGMFFRIVSGDSQIYGLPISDTEFKNNGQLPAQQPLRVTHGTAKYTITSDGLMKVTKIPTTGYRVFVIVVAVILLFFLSWMLWL